MFTSITNFITDVKAGLAAVREDAYTGTTTVYDNKVVQVAHNTAVAVLKAWKWFYTKCAAVCAPIARTVRSAYTTATAFVANNPVSGFAAFTAVSAAAIVVFLTTSSVCVALLAMLVSVYTSAMSITATITNYLRNSTHGVLVQNLIAFVSGFVANTIAWVVAVSVILLVIL